jgi:hypothetical protein
MLFGKKIAVVLPAYSAEKTLDYSGVIPTTVRMGGRKASLSKDWREVARKYAFTSSFPVRTFDQRMSGYYSMTSSAMSPYTLSL